VGVIIRDVKVGDTAPTIRYQLRDRPPIGSRFGVPVDLTSAVSVTVVARRERDQVLVWNNQAVVTDAFTGQIAAVMDSGVTTQPGLVAVEIVVDWPDGTQQTWPAEALTDFLYILVRGDLGMPIPITPTGTVLGPLFIPANGHGVVNRQNQLVFAGPGATIDVAAPVTSFSIAANPNEVAWTALTLPTITQAGATFTPQAITTLMSSSGAEVTLARDPATMNWYGATGTSGGGGGGAVALSYTHSQVAPSTTWTIVSGLTFNPSGVYVEDTTGHPVMYDDVSFPAVGTVVITFLAPQSGTARLS
jgi:hypothetical protein